MGLVASSGLQPGQKKPGGHSFCSDRRAAAQDSGAMPSPLCKAASRSDASSISGQLGAQRIDAEQPRTPQPDRGVGSAAASGSPASHSLVIPTHASPLAPPPRRRAPALASPSLPPSRPPSCRAHVRGRDNGRGGAVELAPLVRRLGPLGAGLIHSPLHRDPRLHAGIPGSARQGGGGTRGGRGGGGKTALAVCSSALRHDPLTPSRAL